MLSLSSKKSHGSWTNADEREKTMSTSKELTVKLECQKCGNTGTATYYQATHFVNGERRTFWHIGTLSGNFSHLEHSLGGAQIVCNNPKKICGANVFNPN